MAQTLALLMTKEQQLGILKTLRTHNERITELVTSMSALISAIWDERLPVGDRYYRYLDVQTKEHDFVATSRAITAQIDQWIADTEESS
jgi:hypothetical protein